MGAKRFLEHSRESGLKLTLDEAEFMRGEWIRAFPEMVKHMKPAAATGSWQDSMGYNKGMILADDILDDDDDEEGDNQATPPDAKKDTYSATLINGMKRNRCSYNSACNIEFQGLTAAGAKESGWELVASGYGSRLCNFVHDEWVYWLYPEELTTHIPYVEHLMIKGMTKAIPDVKIGVETSVMLHWDKKATKFSKLKWTDDGKPIIPEPLKVQKIYGIIQ